MSFYTNTQRDQAREEIIAAHVGFVPRHSDQYSSHGIYAVENQTHAQQAQIMALLGIECAGDIKPIMSKSTSQHITRATQRVKGASKILVNDHVFQQCRLLRQASKLTPVVKAWVECAYLSGDGSKLAQLVTKIYIANYKVRVGTERKCATAVLFAIQRALNTALDREPIKCTEIAKAMGISLPSYRESWAHKVSALSDCLLSLDADYLDLVCFELNFNTYSPSIKTARKYFNVLTV